MRNSTRQSEVPDPKARLRELLNMIWGRFDSISEEQQRSVLSLLEKLAQLERRKQPRRPSLIPVTIDNVHRGSAENISAGGTLIRAAIPLSVGQEVTLDFAFPGSDEPSRMTAEVIWTNPRQMMTGVRFTSVSSDLKDMIKSL